MRGERIGHHQLTAEDVLAIRAEARRGVPNYTLAAWYGVGSSCIAHITHRRTWEWLHDTGDPGIVEGIVVDVGADEHGRPMVSLNLLSWLSEKPEA